MAARALIASARRNRDHAMIVVGPMRRHAATPLLLPVLLLILGGCAAGAASTPTPTGSPPPGSPAPSSGPIVPVTNPDQAAALVIAADPRFAGVGKKDANLIGGCCFYEATAQGDGSFAVTIEVGWGDCPSGCINRHHWFYEVSRDGVVKLLREDGPAVPAGVGSGVGETGGGPGITGQAMAGPWCPVVTQVPDPACDDRPVAGATIVVRDGGGTVVAQVITDAAGRFQITLPPGAYRLEPQPVEGLMGTAGPVDVTVGNGLQVAQVAYDSGIR